VHFLRLSNVLARRAKHTSYQSLKLLGWRVGFFSLCEQFQRKIAKVTHKAVEVYMTLRVEPELLGGPIWLELSLVYFQDTLRYVSAHLWCLRLFMFTKCDYFRLSKTAKMTRKCHNLFVVACLATFCAAANAGDCGLFKFDDGKYVEPFSAPSKVLVWVWSHWHFDSHKAVFVVASHNEVGICVRCVFLCRAVNPYTLLIELL